MKFWYEILWKSGRD